MNEAETVKVGDVWVGGEGVQVVVTHVGKHSMRGTFQDPSMLNWDFQTTISDFLDWGDVPVAGYGLIERDGHPVKEQGDG